MWQWEERWLEISHLLSWCRRQSAPHLPLTWTLSTTSSSFTPPTPAGQHRLTNKWPQSFFQHLLLPALLPVTPAQCSTQGQDKWGTWNLWQLQIWKVLPRVKTGEPRTKWEETFSEEDQLVQWHTLPTILQAPAKPSTCLQTSARADISRIYFWQDENRPENFPPQQNYVIFLLLPLLRFLFSNQNLLARFLFPPVACSHPRRCRKYLQSPRRCLPALQHKYRFLRPASGNSYHGDWELWWFLWQTSREDYTISDRLQRTFRWEQSGGYSTTFTSIHQHPHTE